MESVITVLYEIKGFSCEWKFNYKSHDSRPCLCKQMLQVEVSNCLKRNQPPSIQLKSIHDLATVFRV